MKKIILYGAGHFGKCALHRYGERVAFFCDKTHQGEQVEGVPVIGMEELKRIHCGYEVMVTPIEAKARGSIGMELEKAGIPFSFAYSMHGMLHIHGRYPDISYEYESGVLDFRVRLTLDMYRSMFRKFSTDFAKKFLESWLFCFDEPLMAFEYMTHMRLGHIHAYATMFPVQDKVIPIPDYYACYEEDVYAYQEFSPAKCREAAERPWEEGKCFWRGNLFNGMEPRTMLWLMGQKYPEYLQIERSDRGNRVSMVEQARYKYLLDVRGVGWTDRVKVLLQLGRPLFLVDRPYKEWYFDWMEPMRHYVPVKEDLSDLIPKLQFLENHPEIYDSIVQSTKEFVEYHLIGEPVLKYLRDVTLRHDVVSDLEKREWPWAEDAYQSGRLMQDCEGIA